MTDVVKEISVVGTSCPVPLIKLSQAVKELQAGDAFKIIGDDPIFERGVREFCEVNEYVISHVANKEDGSIEITIKL